MTVLEDWEQDFPGIEKPARAWRDLITTLISQYLEDPEKAEGVRKAFHDEASDITFPFDIDLKEFTEEKKTETIENGGTLYNFVQVAGKT